MFFYSDTSSSSGVQINVWKMNGTKQYLRHYDQYLFLDFVAKSPRATQGEKAQARKELTIAERKLDFWSKHPNYDQREALAGVKNLKKQWASGERSVA